VTEHAAAFAEAHDITAFAVNHDITAFAVGP